MSISQDEENSSHFTEEKIETLSMTQVLQMWTMYAVVQILALYYTPVWSLGDPSVSMYLLRDASTLCYIGQAEDTTWTTAVRVLPVGNRWC